MGRNLQIAYKNIEELIPYIRNPKKHDILQIELIANSIKEFGFLNPIIIDKDNNIIAGHGRLLASKRLGLKKVPTLLVSHLTPAQIKAYRIVDNKLTELGDWDTELLKVEIDLLREEDFDLDLLGFSEEELEDLSSSLEEDLNFNEEDEDKIPDAPSEGESFSKKGDLWLLGRHKVLCGDSLNMDDLKLLLANEKVDSLITDPPYGVDYSNKNKFLNTVGEGNRIQRDIVNDDIEDYRHWFSVWLFNVSKVMADYNTFYIFMSGKEFHNLVLAIEDVGGYKSCDLVWVKNNHVLGRQDYSSKHELIVYGWFGKHKFYGDFSTTVLEFDKPLKSDLHPT